MISRHLLDIDRVIAERRTDGLEVPDRPTAAAIETVHELLDRVEVIVAEDGRGLILAIPFGSSKNLAMHIDPDGAVVEIATV